MAVVHVVMREEMGWYDPEEVFASIDEDEVQSFFDELERRDDCNYWMDKIQCESEQAAIDYVRRGDTEVWEVFFSIDDPDYEKGALRYDIPQWVFAKENPPLTWIKWNNPYVSVAGTVYVPATETNPLEVARQYISVEYAKLMPS